MNTYVTGTTIRQLRDLKLKIPCFDTSYDLSESEDCVSYLKDLIDAGIDCIKIEGRAKSFYYVAVVTNAYRQALDLYWQDPENYVLPAWLEEETRKVSHRQYSTGFYFGRPEEGQYYENGGYVMEDLILKLTDMDLDSCWVTFTDSDHVKDALGLESDLQVAAIAAFGYGEKTTRRLRLNIKSMSNIDIIAKRQYFEPKVSVKELVHREQWGSREGLEDAIGFYDDMLWEAFYAASLAPSYLNRQAYGFVIHDGRITLVSRPDPFNTPNDGDLSLGAALLHFSAVAENWVGRIHWLLGSEASRLVLPEGHRSVATCIL